MIKNKNIIICVLWIFFIILSFSKSYAVDVKPGGTATVVYTITSPDGSNLSTVTGKLNYDTSLLECTQISSSAGYAKNGTISATESQINGTKMTVTAVYKVKSGISNKTISTSINLSELYTVNSDKNQASSLRPSGNINVIEESSNSSSGSSSSSNSSSSSSGNSSQTGSNSAETTKKSSNANLSNLGIKPNDFTGFKSGTTTYNVTVPNEVDSVEVYATKADSKAKITGTGTKSLQEGENALSVVVTAEDGTTKTYTINVTREVAKEEENTEKETEVKKGLSSISINNLELNPEFATDVYEYTVKYIGEETSLDITTVPTDANYKIEILGNQELKEGENIVTILVTDAEGNNIATYQLIVNKELKEEVVENIEEKTTNDDFQKMIVIAGGIAVLIIILIVIIIIKHKRNKAYAEEFSGVPFSKLKDEDEDYENELDERKKAKKEFLSGFDNDQDVIEEKVKRNKKKGKRFK